MSESGNGVEVFANQAIRTVLSTLGLKADVLIRRRPKGAREPLVVELRPDDQRQLDSRRWTQTSQALALLLEAALLSRGEDVPVSVLLPAPEPGIPESSPQAEGLEAAVRDLAERAVARGLSFAIGPMATGDRRLVHQALGEVKGVWTQSVGDGIFRRLWVMPQGEAQSEEPPSDDSSGDDA